MKSAVCFNCEELLLGVGKPMEELIKDRFPIFCSQLCGEQFPFNGTKEFEERLKHLREKFNVA